MSVITRAIDDIDNQKTAKLGPSSSMRNYGKCEDFHPQSQGGRNSLSNYRLSNYLIGMNPVLVVTSFSSLTNLVGMAYSSVIPCFNRLHYFPCYVDSRSIVKNRTMIFLEPLILIVFLLRGNGVIYFLRVAVYRNAYWIQWCMSRFIPWCRQIHCAGWRLHQQTINFTI